MKPLGTKSYGSNPHLPGSRVGQGDYHISEGQANIATVKTRDRHDLVIMQEKLDGSNVSAAKVNGEIVALTRSRYLASTSPYLQLHWRSARDIFRLEKGFHNPYIMKALFVCGNWWNRSVKKPSHF